MAKLARAWRSRDAKRAAGALFRCTSVWATVAWTGATVGNLVAFDDELCLQLDHDASGDFTAKDAGDFFGQTVKWDNIGKFLKVIQPPVIGEPLP